MIEDLLLKGFKPVFEYINQIVCELLYEDYLPVVYEEKKNGSIKRNY